MMPTSTRLSKSRLIAFRQCPKRLWLELHRPELKDESGAVLRFRAGYEVGAVARSLVPEGRLIPHESDLDAALRETQEALRTEPHRPLFEPAFRHGDLLVRADVLMDPKGAARLVEVKSTASVKEYHYEDVAIQSHVVKASGIDLASAHVAHVNTQWVYPGGQAYAGLLNEVDVSAAIAPAMQQVPTWLSEAQGVAAGPEPDIAIGAQCSSPFACPFQGYCESLAGPRPEYAVELLPGKDGKALARRLREAGFEDLRDVPESRVAGALLARIHQATRTGRAHLDSGARRAMADWAFPRYWLDFETIGFAVPVWAGTRPYQQIPFQWSCHVERSHGELEYEYFLDLSGADPRRACAEALLRALGQRGAIVTYHASFERGVLRELAQCFPDLARGLQALHDRVVDLEPVVKAHYYHPGMMGSFSIKAVLPTIAPELDYATLGEVQDGDMAQAAYVESIRLDTTPERKAKLERDLLDYCERDTLAMVEVARGLAG